MNNKRFYVIYLFLFTFSVVFCGFSAVQAGSGSKSVPNVKFKEWQVGRSDKGTDKDNSVHISFITSTETSCWFSASVGYVGGSQPDNTSPIDPATVAWSVVDASHSMMLDESSVKKNWTGSDPSEFNTSTSFNVVAKLTVPVYTKYGCTQTLDAKRKDREPVHREGKKMSFKIKFSAKTKVGCKVEKLLSLKADDKDQIRQEYVDLNRPIPTRENNASKLTSWAGENTYDFGHYKTMMDHGLDGYFQDWIDAMNKMYRKGKNDANGDPLSTLEKSDFMLNSGYRNPHHNHHHSGSTGLSSHMYGYALDVNGRDLDGVEGADQSDMVTAAETSKEDGGAGARYSRRYTNKSHVHVDWAPNSPTKWTSRKKTADDPPSFELPDKTTTMTNPKTSLMPGFSPASDSSYTASAGDTHTGEVRSSEPIYGVGLLVNRNFIQWVWGSETTTSLLMSYTFPEDASGSYTMQAYVFVREGNSYSFLDNYSYVVEVSTQQTVPGVPLSLSAAGSNGAVLLSWLPPLNDGNSPITSYEYRYGRGASVLPIDYTVWTSTGGTSLSHTVS